MKQTGYYSIYIKSRFQFDTIIFVSFMKYKFQFSSSSLLFINLNQKCSDFCAFNYLHDLYPLQLKEKQKSVDKDASANTRHSMIARMVLVWLTFRLFSWQTYARSEFLSSSPPYFHIPNFDLYQIPGAHYMFHTSLYRYRCQHHPKSSFKSLMANFQITTNNNLFSSVMNFIIHLTFQVLSQHLNLFPLYLLVICV